MITLQITLEQAHQLFQDQKKQRATLERHVATLSDMDLRTKRQKYLSQEATSTTVQEYWNLRIEHTEMMIAYPTLSEPEASTQCRLRKERGLGYHPLDINGFLLPEPELQPRFQDAQPEESSIAPRFHPRSLAGPAPTLTSTLAVPHSESTKEQDTEIE
jgi:hypothetical protein